METNGLADAPNFVYIFCDELRADALGCYGGAVPTPNIDALAAKGTLFERSYCTSPVCVASRYSILTGRYPEETGVYHNEAAYPAYPTLDGFTTFTEVLQGAGYRVASFGKTHIPKTATPAFEYNDERGGEMRLGLEPGEAQHVFKPAGTFKSILAADYPGDRPYGPRQVTDKGLAWMSEHAGGDNPFFVRFSYLQPHTPIIVPEGYVERVPPEAVRGVVTLCETSLFEQRFAEVCDIDSMSEDDVTLIRRYYQALVLWVDDQVGEIVDAVSRLGNGRDTVVIFHADHGASRGEGGALAKQIFARQSHRVPLIVGAPGRLEPGRRLGVCDGLDIAPTVLGMAGIACPASYRGVDLRCGEKGESYATIGYGEEISRAFPNKDQGTWFDGSGWPRRSCIRTQRYRLDMTVRHNGVAIPQGEDVFFCDCEEHPLEDVNQADDPRYADVVAELRAKLLEHVATSREVDDTEALRVPPRPRA